MYPHEILLLEYAESFYTDRESFQLFWLLKYGIRDMPSLLSSLVKRGFLSEGSLQQTLKNETDVALKRALSTFGLAVKGEKDDLIARLTEKVPERKLVIVFPRRSYILTDRGKDALKGNEYILYVHNNPIEDLDIWSLSKLMHQSSFKHYQAVIWGYLKMRSLEYSNASDYKAYRNLRLKMFDFLVKENKAAVALPYLLEVIDFDLSGISDGFDPQQLNILSDNLFSYQDSRVKIPRDVIARISRLQSNEKLTEEDLKQQLLEAFRRRKLPLYIFTPTECAAITLFEMKGNKEAVARVYNRAKTRYKQKHPDIES